MKYSIGYAWQVIRDKLNITEDSNKELILAVATISQFINIHDSGVETTMYNYPSIDIE